MAENVSVAAPFGGYEYIASEENVAEVRNLARKIVEAGAINALMRPIRNFRLNHLVMPVESLAMIQTEATLSDDEELVWPAVLTGSELAEEILRVESN